MNLRRLGFGFVALLAAAPLFAADIDGKWITNGETGTLTFELKSDGPTISGTVVMKGGDLNLGSQRIPVEGTILGDGKVILHHRMPTGYDSGARWVEINYRGTLKGDELDLVGTVDLGQGSRQDKFLAKRAK